jgi:hypothetical protein
MAQLSEAPDATALQLSEVQPPATQTSVAGKLLAQTAQVGSPQASAVMQTAPPLVELPLLVVAPPVEELLLVSPPLVETPLLVLPPVETPLLVLPPAVETLAVNPPLVPPELVAVVTVVVPTVDATVTLPPELVAPIAVDAELVGPAPNGQQRESERQVIPCGRSEVLAQTSFPPGTDCTQASANARPQRVSRDAHRKALTT